MSPRKIKIIESNNNSNQSITVLFDKFINYCVISNYSKATITYYGNTIRNFSLFANLTEIKIDDLDQALIEEYIKYLQNKKTKDGSPLRGKTIKTYLVGLRTILNWCACEGYIQKIRVLIPKSDQPLKKSYTEQQLKALVKKPEIKTCDFTDIRDWALVNYLIGTGQRLSTVINIKIADVDMENNTVTLFKLKNRTETILPLATSVISVLKEYLKYRKGKSEDYLFCNTTGGQLSVRGTQDAVAFYNRNRGVNLTSIHAFRHTFAKRSLMSGMDVITLQQLMTHKDLNSTRVYLSMTTEDLRPSLEDFNPLSAIQEEKRRKKIRIE